MDLKDSYGLKRQLGGGPKGLERQRIIGSAVAGFNHTRTITKAYAKGSDAGKAYSNKRICSPGRLVNNPVR